MNLQSWGNYPKVEHTTHRFNRPESLKKIIHDHDEMIAYGNGRSYGDSALSTNLICVKPYNYLLDFDKGEGLLHCQAGVLLSDILEAFVPRGWFLCITPGTKLITVGGAIASDVHGKNHHVAGSFSNCVVEMKLMLVDGQTITCSRTENTELFNATCGGMGLTGIILDAKIKLQPIQSSMMDQMTIKTANLRETFDAFENYKDFTYSVAWIDCLEKGDNLGRSLLTVAEHATDGSLEYGGNRKVAVPFMFPSFVLNNTTVRAFNSLYYAKASKGATKQKVGIDNFFYPLDAIGCWNRIYGRRGFTQYQFVLPLENSYQGLEKILIKISESGKGSFLAVLKLFGEANCNWLSFPMKGFTLALDFKIDAHLFEWLDELDSIVLQYGGRFYLAKDARVSRETFQAGYKNIEKFRRLRKGYKMDKKFNSLQSKRVGI